ncbi:PAS domain-containing protein [Sphingomonas sp.]|jgi:two-component system CheB/CheR fusion protein|uniref:PAS domain-containing protein n=1 Tax=Sphingomonas sp. TaxID=28214 RepID=UPI002ED82084
MSEPAGTSARLAAELIDENEQLRAALETALEENTALVEDRDRLLRRVSELARQLQDSKSFSRHTVDAGKEIDAAASRQSQTEEELRVAFEELQVLTEELEVANTSLHQTNQELDLRVEERTREIREINASLRSAEASFRTVADLVPDLLWRADRRGEATWFNQRWFDFTGQGGDEPLGFGWLEAIHPEDRALSRTSWSAAVSSGKPYQHEHRLCDSAGNYRWFLMRAEPLRDEGGRILLWFAAGTDIHDQRMAMEALQQSEVRFRTLIEGMPQLVWRAVEAGKWTWCSPQWTEYTGQSEEAARDMGWLRSFHPDDRETARAAWKLAQDSGALEIEGRIFHAAEERYRHFRTRAEPVRDEQGQIAEWLGTSTDVDDILQLQQQQGVLVGELQHRTRNLMAIVQSVTMRTLRGAETLEDFKRCIDDRLQTLARVQGLLSRREGGLRVAFDALIREELSTHVELDGTGNGQQVSLRGPGGVGLRSATVQTLALALHELATNAVKYGALSERQGHLRVEWGLKDEGAAERALWIDWRESGVADIPGADEGPRGGGYGRELIERALPYQLGARTSYAFEADGVHCTIEVAVPSEDIQMEKSDA